VRFARGLHTWLDLERILPLKEASNVVGLSQHSLKRHHARALLLGEGTAPNTLERRKSRQRSESSCHNRLLSTSRSIKFSRINCSMPDKS
jgi:hypothetical protein